MNLHVERHITFKKHNSLGTSTGEFWEFCLTELTRAKRDEITAWCFDNVEAHLTFSEHTAEKKLAAHPRYNMEVSIANKGSATLFKLTWGGK